MLSQQQEETAIQSSPSPPANNLPAVTPTDSSVEILSDRGDIYAAEQRLLLHEAATSLSLLTGAFPSHPDSLALQGSSYDIHSENVLLEERSILQDTSEPEQHISVQPAPVEGHGVHELSAPSISSPLSSLVPDKTNSCATPSDDWQPKPFLIAPLGLLEAAKFTQDMIYYHHLCDPSPHGLLSILGLTDILQFDGLDKGFFHAALALSALHASQSSTSSTFTRDAAIHALDHFVEALGFIRGSRPDDNLHIDVPSPEQNRITWLATLLLLAQFELSRGQMRLWYVHSYAAVTCLSQNISQVSETPVGGSLIRSFSRIASLLEIFDRSYTARHGFVRSDVSVRRLLFNSLKISQSPGDRLLVILPRIIEFEEDCRSTPGLDLHWRHQARALIDELKEWRMSLDNRDVPSLDELQIEPWEMSEDESSMTIRPLLLSRANEPVKAATNFMHYLVSLIRLEIEYLPGVGRQLPANANKLILVVCRLAAGISGSTCAAINAYGHGMVPAMMNAYYMSEEETAKRWIKDWLSRFPSKREGIWDVKYARRLLEYVDQEYSRRGSRSNWEIIKVRMVDLEEEGMSGDSQEDPDRFPVEIYSRCKRGWSIDFVDIP